MPTNLDEDTLARMRAPPTDSHSGLSVENDSSSDSEKERGKQSTLPRTLPGSFSTGSNDNAYY